MNFFSEISGPAFSGNPDSVPSPQGEQIDPINAFTLTTLQFKVNNRARLFWQQAIPVNITANQSNPGFNLGFSDPQVGATFLQSSSAQLSISTDIFLNLGASVASRGAGRWGDAGARFSLSYQPPGSSWTFGGNTQVRGGLFRGTAWSPASDIVTSATLWGTYAISPKLSTQHWVSSGWRSFRGEPGFVWSSPGEPVAQNGLGYQMTQKIWVAALLNNYLFTTPSLRNSWTSLWLSINVL